MGNTRGNRKEKKRGKVGNYGWKIKEKKKEALRGGAGEQIDLPPRPAGQIQQTDQ